MPIGPLPTAPGVVGLDAPVRSLKMLELQIKAGATEVHVGLRSRAPVSFDGLPANRDGEPTQVVSGDEPTAPVDDDGQRTQVIRPKSEQDDQPTERWR